MAMPIKAMIRKYFIMGSQDCKEDPAFILEAAAKAGITAYQFREKGTSSLSGEEKIILGKELRAISHEYNIPFIVNDDVELVSLLDADGIHVGQDDHSINDLRERFPDKIIGLSVSTEEELNNSPIELIDYVGAGPIFDTTSKSDAKETVGLEWIIELRAKFPDLPIVGIGGINTANAPSVVKAGADGVSFISAITQADDIEKAVKAL